MWWRAPSGCNEWSALGFVESDYWTGMLLSQVKSHLVV